MRTIWLQWASRLGKTFFGQSCLLYTAAVAASSLMLAGASQDSAIDVNERTYAMAEQCLPLKAQLLPPGERNQKEIVFTRCRLHVAWARSAVTLADKNIKVGLAFEFDKWEHKGIRSKRAKEADPGKLFDERFKNEPDHKKIKDSTPTIKDRSRIEAGRLASTDCHLEVPCPHCHHYQKLVMGDGETHGLRYDKPADRKRDDELAQRTAVYICESCHEPITSDLRTWMMQRGVWCPAGCTVDNTEALRVAELHLAAHSGVIGGDGASLTDGYEWSGWANASWIRGTPLRDGGDAGYQLSSLYALTLSWGDIAKEWVRCQDKPTDLQNFINSWLGETWSPTKSATTPELLGRRLGTSSPVGVVPAGARFLTATADKQAAHGGFIVFCVLAHGEGERAWVVDYGIVDTLADFWTHVFRRSYPAADGGPEFQPISGAVDSGHDTKAVYDFCAEHPGLVPCKGGGDLGGEPYRYSFLGDEERKKSRTGVNDQGLLMVNTDFWETELQHRLDERKVGEPGSLGLCVGLARDHEALEELLNSQLGDVVDIRGNAKLLWVKREEHKPNDLRDAVRYGLCLGRLELDDGGLPERERPQPKKGERSAEPKAKEQPFVRPVRGGWIRRQETSRQEAGR